MANKTLFRSIAGKLLPHTDSTNEAGGQAYRLDPKHALAQYAATGCLNSTFYATAQVQLDAVLKLTEQVEPEFLAQTALYARRDGFMKEPSGVADRGVVRAFAWPNGRGVRSGDRFAEDAPQLRSDHAFGRGRPQVARLAAQADGAAVDRAAYQHPAVLWFGRQRPVIGGHYQDGPP